jgi:predicted ArsR family transcriptional regulator
VPPSYSPRELRTATELRALAHPLRASLLEALITEGPLTATECAERTGESPANCSWHLRQLAKYGFVEEAEGGVGRQRPWRAIPTGLRWEPGEPHTEFAAASDALGEMWLNHQLERFHAYMGRREEEPAAWRAAALMGQSLAWLTDTELAELGEHLTEVLVRYVDRVHPHNRPEGARLVRLITLGFPDRPPAPDEPSPPQGDDSDNPTDPTHEPDAGQEN